MDREGARPACVAAGPSLLTFVHRRSSRARDVFGVDLVHLHSASPLLHPGQQRGHRRQLALDEAQRVDSRDHEGLEVGAGEATLL